MVARFRDANTLVLLMRSTLINLYKYDKYLA